MNISSDTDSAGVAEKLLHRKNRSGCSATLCATSGTTRRRALPKTICIFSAAAEAAPFQSVGRSGLITNYRFFLPFAFFFPGAARFGFVGLLE
jgi:hypothetical protein